MANPRQEEFDRVTQYLKAQAAKLTHHELMAKVRADSAQLRDAAEAAARVDTQKRPAEEDWSVNEVLAHIVTSSRGVNTSILQAAFEGTQPGRIRDIIERTDEVRPPAEWFAILSAEREATFDRLAAAKGDEHLDIKWEHPFFGNLDWREWLLFLRVHDLDHARQLGQVIEALSR